MLTVTLYEFKKRENSTKRPDASVTQKEHQAVLKMPTSLLRPEITFDFGLKGNPSFYNYAYISDLGNRYYFIRDWTVSEGHLWTAHMEVDVLASWKISIGESTQYVLRSSFTSNGNIIDKEYPAIAPATLEIAESEGVIKWPVVNSIEGGSYVVGIINKSEDAVGAVAYYVFTSSQFRTFMKYMLGDTTWIGEITDITDELTRVLFNPMQYIASVMWYPDIAPKGGAIEDVPFGWWDMHTPAAKLVTSGALARDYVFTIPKHPQMSTRGSYLQLSPYSVYTLDSRVWGQIPIDTSEIYDAGKLGMNVEIDYITGIANLRVVRYDNKYSLATRQAQYGVPVKIAQIGVDYVNATLSTASAALGAADETVSAFSNPIKGASGAWGITAAKGVVDTVQTAVNAYLPQMSTSGNNGSVANFMQPPRLYAKFAPLVNEDNADLGRPLCSTKQLSTIPGFQMVLHADIAIAGTSEENSAIKAYLESGYFYE